jgi:NCAIR mutase (PurE)-related protein
LVSEVTLDFDREHRTGFSEAVISAGKSMSQLQTIMQQVMDKESATLFTRLEQEQFDQLDSVFPGELDYDPVSRTAIYKLVPLKDDSVDIAVVTAGSSDVPVAREAVRTLRFYGADSLEVNDVGVAGLWRLTHRLPDLKDIPVLICAAGMDAALPTILSGLVPGLVIAVPTSTGYGVARHGETALNALLCSCAPGLVVVNIDNGFGAACAALRSRVTRQ